MQDHHGAAASSVGAQALKADNSAYVSGEAPLSLMLQAVDRCLEPLTPRTARMMDSADVGIPYNTVVWIVDVFGAGTGTVRRRR